MSHKEQFWIKLNKSKCLTKSCEILKEMTFTLSLKL